MQENTDLNTALATSPGADVEVMSYYNEAIKLQQYAEGRVIASVEDMKTATDDLSLIAKLKKVMENKRKSLLDPLKFQADAIRETYSTLMDPIFRADRLTRDKMLAYDAEQKRIRAQQEEINRKRQEAADTEMRLRGELSESVNLVEVAPPTPTTIRTDVGVSGMMKIRKYRVVNFAELPDQYKIENSALLNKVVKAGIPEIPGVEIYEEPVLRVTPSN